MSRHLPRRRPADDLLRVMPKLPAGVVGRAAAAVRALWRHGGRPLPRGATEMRLVEALEDAGCPVCRVTQGSDERWIFWFLHENHLEPEVLDALSASLGFCPGHGERLLREPSARTQIATVHRIVVERLRARWRTGRDFAAWEAGLLRSGGRAGPCPACRAQAEAVHDAVALCAGQLQSGRRGALAAAPARLCLPHLQLVGARLGREGLAQLLATHEATLSGALQEPFEGTGRADVGLAVGHHPGAVALPPAGTEVAGRLPDPVRTLERDLRSGAGCAVCLEVRRAWVERLSWLEARAERDARGLDDLLPTCPEHVFWTLGAAGPELARATRARALDTALKSVRQGMQVLRDSAAQRSGQGAPSWLAALVGGRDALRQRALDAMRRGLDCPACAWLAAARDRTLRLLFALLEQQGQRSAFESGYGLCLLHLARALALGPAPAPRACLHQVMQAKLAVLEWELTEYARKSAWLARAEPKGTELLAPVRAVHRCSGFLAAPPEPSGKA